MYLLQIATVIDKEKRFDNYELPCIQRRPRRLRPINWCLFELHFASIWLHNSWSDILDLRGL